MADYQQGTLVTVTATFSVSGTVTDPSTVSAEWRDPGLVTHPVTPTKVSTGVYSITVDTTSYAGGEVTAKFTGTGVAQVVGFTTFGITPNEF